MVKLQGNCSANQNSLVVYMQNISTKKRGTRGELKKKVREEHAPHGKFPGRG
jgi:hypothetical protein